MNERSDGGNLSEFHCKHEGEIRSLQSQVSDLFDLQRETQKDVTQTNLILKGNGVRGLTATVEDIDERVAVVEEKLMTEDSVKAAVKAAMSEGVTTTRDALSLKRERNQVLLSRIGITSAIVIGLLTALDKLGIL